MELVLAMAMSAVGQCEGRARDGDSLVVHTFGGGALDNGLSWTGSKIEVVGGWWLPLKTRRAAASV